MPYVTGRRVWVDLAHTGTEDGSFENPFNTVPEGVAAVPTAGSLIFKGGTTDWTGTITKSMTLRALGGSTWIGP